MENNLEILNQKLTLNLSECDIARGLIGIEKEALRIENNQISTSKHPRVLGDKLTNIYITTDFAESQIELITPPLSNNQQTLNFLDDLNHFVAHKTEDNLWPFSMPPFIENESDIALADFGNTNKGLFKNIYRRGLSLRYGRLMQSISGIHFNYSFPDSLLNHIARQYKLTNNKKFRSAIYLKTIRNVQRNNWLLLYMFGSSPIVSSNFLNNDFSFTELGDSYYLSNATTLRMSELGYQNINQSNLHVSFNTIEEYCDDLISLTRRPAKKYMQIKDSFGEGRTQLSKNLLQIEAEYYAASRPKSNSISKKRLAKQLRDHGVDYIELRSIDINPFSRQGIDIATINFLEVFLLFCCIDKSDYIIEKDLVEIRNNDLLVAKKGREKGLFLSKNHTQTSFRELASKILDAMSEIASVIGYDSDFIENYKLKVLHPELTLSGRVLKTALDNEIALDELGYLIAENNNKYYVERSIKNNSNFNKIQKEVDLSTEKKGDLIDEGDVDFDKYLKDYFHN